MRQMTCIVAGFILASLVVGISARAEDPAVPDEKPKIEAALRDYIDGWYEGNAERMARALHPDLRKQGIMTLPDGKVFVNESSASAMVAFTRAGFGKKKARPDQKNQVVILDVSGDLASAKSVSPDFIDYIHLARIDGQWKIVNVLWEPLPEKPKAP